MYLSIQLGTKEGDREVPGAYRIGKRTGLPCISDFTPEEEEQTEHAPWGRTPPDPYLS